MLRMAVAVLILAVSSSSALATPFFARQYRMQCSGCHSGFPRLNAFGLAFKANGFRIPGQESSPKLAFDRNIPVAAQVKPTSLHFFNNPGSVKFDYTDTQILAGGLLTKKTAFFMHHSYFIDADPQIFPSYELWIQQVLNERGKIMLRAGQFELPLAYSPEINRAPISLPMPLFLGLQSRDVPLAAPMSGIQITAAPSDRLQAALVISAPGAVSSANLTGERQFFGRFKDVFARLATGPPTRNAGLFAFITETHRLVNGTQINDDAWRIGADGVLFIAGNQLHAMALYGVDNDPRGTGKAGTLRGGFIEADRMIKPWLGVTARWEVANLHTTVSRSYQDARTFSLRVYPARWVKLAAEYQDLDHGRSTTGFLADISF